MSNLDGFIKKELQVSIPISKIWKPKIKDIDLAIIDADVYYSAYYLKGAHMFAISMRTI